MPPLVSPQWLAEHMHEVVILDATLPPVGVQPAPDTHAAYLDQHIPGAVFFNIDTLSDPTSGLPHTLPTAQAFGQAMSALGVSSTATLVVYEQGPVFSAPRARWMLQTMGAADVFLLDGGLQAWLNEALPTESGPVTRHSADFQATLDISAITSFDQLQQTLAAHGQVLDARSTGRFTGTALEPRPGLSSGHMPGAVSMPYTGLTDGDRMLSSPQLEQLFADKGVDLYRPITTTCGSGITAAVVLLAAELAGAQDLSLYDGSWAEYAQKPDGVIVRDDTA